MSAGDAFELEGAWWSEGDVVDMDGCVTDGFADEDFASVGLAGNSGGHGYVKSEEVVASSYGCALVDAYAYLDLVPSFGVIAEGVLDA